MFHNLNIELKTIPSHKYKLQYREKCIIKRMIRINHNRRALKNKECKMPIIVFLISMTKGKLQPPQKHQIQLMKGWILYQTRIQLIDKILERKDEMMVAQLKLKAVKLEPIFNVIRRKLRKQRLGSATPNQSKKGTLILRQNTTDDFGKILTEPSKDQKDSKEHQLQRQETIMEDQIIEQLQTKVTAGVAFQWLANRHDTKQMAQIESDTSNDRQYLRRATALQYGKNTINRLKQQVSKKVSENSEELIKQGINRLETKKDRFDPLKIKAKVDSGLQKIQASLPYPKINVNKRQKTLAFITSERRELKMIGELLSERNTNDQKRRKEANTELMIV